MYAPYGEVETHVMDLGAAPTTAPTYTLTYDGPSGTSVAVTASMSSTDGLTWSSWSSVDGDGSLTSPLARYWRLRIALTSTDPSSTPILRSVTLQAPNTTPSNWRYGYGGAWS
jgi:hypothetical protein